MSDQKYDFNFICLSFGLIPLFQSKAAIAPGAIVDIRYERADDNWRVTLHGGTVYTLSHPEMAELEANIRQRAEDGKILAREGFKQNAVMQNEVIQELQRGVVGAIVDVGRKRRHS
jgi:hypothetical protein